MNIRNALLATVALMGTAVLAAPALASSPPPTVTLSSFGDADVLPAGQRLIANFNDPSQPDAVVPATGFALTLTGATVGVDEGVGGYSGTLYGDPTHYLTIPGGASAELTSFKGITAFSLYMGSPDTYNSIRFIGAGYDYTMPGSELVLGDTNQSWSWGKRVNFDFGSNKVTNIILSSSGNSLEVDNFAAAPVPEAATWAMMLGGFGLMGAAIRRRRTALAYA